jgi:6-phospho-beta-glucosidase
MAFLDSDAVVEVPTVIGPVGPVPVAVGDVPTLQREMIERVKAVERTTIRAARARSATLATEALSMHPLVPSRQTAERIFAAYASAHAELRDFR